MTSHILDEIYEQDSNAKRYDRYLATLCPWHDYDTPSLSLLIYEDSYHCLSCGRWGKTKDYLVQYSSYSSIPRKPENTFVRNPFNKWLWKEELSPVLKRAYRALKNFPDQGSYLRKRNLTPEEIKKLKFGYLDGYYLIPILDTDRKVVGAFARAGESIEGVRYFVPKNQNPNLLYSPDWEAVKDAKEVYLTFGSFDAIAIWQCGKAAMSTTSGKRLHPSALQDFRKRIIIFPDRGEEVDAKRLELKLGWRGTTKNYKYPYGLKDPADLYSHNLLQQALT